MLTINVINIVISAYNVFVVVNTAVSTVSPASNPFKQGEFGTIKKLNNKVTTLR